MMMTIGPFIGAIATILATSAIAADMPLKASPPPQTPTSTWTGFYVGANAGYGWMDPAVSFARTTL
jgi:outer membrane immunogenic protein